MTLDLCQRAMAELGCLVDRGSLHTSTWFASLRPVRTRPARTFASLADAVRAAADQLPVADAHALWLVDVCGVSYEQGAVELATTPRRFAGRVRRARRIIRRAVA